MIALIPLHSGTVKDVFERVRPPARKIERTPALDVHSPQCVHVEEIHDEKSDSYYLDRCLEDADLRGRSGWLCKKHKVQTEPRAKVNPVRRMPDFELTEGIKLGDARAIARKGREVIHHGRISIQFVDKVRMKLDPEQFLRKEAEVNHERL